MIKFILLASILFIFASLKARMSFAGEVGQGAAAAKPQGASSVNVETDLRTYLAALDKPIPASFKDADDDLLARWLRQKYKDYTAACRSFFITPSNMLGEPSQLASKALVQKVLDQGGAKSKFMTGTPRVHALCPGFDKLKPHQKIAFYNWAMELTAFPESTCNVQVHPNTHGTPNGAAVCLYQENGRRSDRSWRGAHCDVPSVSDLHNCTLCAVDMMAYQIDHLGELFGFQQDGKLHKAYWASWNPLSATEEACYQKYLDPQGNPKTIKGKPVYQTACNPGGKSSKFYMAEWTPRYKFVRRIQRFPLCETELARKEVSSLGK